MARFDAVLFDVDGTLIYSSPGILATLEYTFQAVGIDPAGIDLARYLGPPLRRSFAQHCSTPAQVEQMVDIYRQQYRKVGQHQCQVFAGVKGMLAALKQADIKLYTATSKPVAVVTPILQQQGLAHDFKFIGGASEDSSVDTKTAVMRLVLTRPELAGQRVLMVGDRKDDMQGAADCCVPAAAVLYGYGSREELTPFQPVILADTPAQLTSYILNINE